MQSINAGFELAAANLAYCLYERKVGDYLSIAEEAMDEVSTHIKAYAGTLSDAEDNRLYKEMLSRWKAYRTYFAMLKAFILSGRFDEGIAMRTTDGGKIRRSCRAAASEVDVFIRQSGNHDP